MKQISREEFEQLAGALSDICMRAVKLSVKDADISFDEINEIVMVGRSSRMPILKKRLRDYFDDFITINDEKDLVEVVALGAALVGRIMLGLDSSR